MPSATPPPKVSPTHFEQIPLAAVPTAATVLSPARGDARTEPEPSPGQRRLFWSMHSEVACQEHAPAETDPRWQAEGWAAIPVNERPSHFARYQCQHCSPTGRPVRHVSGRSAVLNQ